MAIVSSWSSCVSRQPRLRGAGVARRIARRRPQTWPERVHISVNGAFQATSNDFSDRVRVRARPRDRIDRNRLPGPGRVRCSTPARASGCGRISRRRRGLLLHARRYGGHDVELPASVLLQPAAEVTGEATGVNRSETAAHVQAMYLVNPGGRLRLVLSGGPSFFAVQQDVVTEVTITETYPFDTATFASAQDEPREGSAVAFNAGADVMWMLTPGSASAAWYATRAPPSTSTRRVTGRSRWTQGACMRAAGSGVVLRRTTLTLTLNRPPAWTMARWYDAHDEALGVGVIVTIVPSCPSCRRRVGASVTTVRPWAGVNGGRFIRTPRALRRAPHPAGPCRDLRRRGRRGREAEGGSSGREYHARVPARDVPCHRVIAAGGRLGGYGGSLEYEARPPQGRGIRRLWRASPRVCCPASAQTGEITAEMRATRRGPCRLT